MDDSQKYPDSQLASQHNDLIFGRQAFSLLQKRLYLLAVAQIERKDEQLHPYRVAVKDVVQSGSSVDIYNRLNELTDQLMRKIFRRRFTTSSGKKGFEKWPMINYAKHIEGEGDIEIDFHPRMEELLLNLQEQGHFTPVPIVNQLACRSTYGQRMYGMLYSWRRHGKMEIKVDELREALNLQNKYKSFTHFRRYVLEKARNDLQKHTNMRFTWEEEKRGKGKKVTHLIFNFEFDPDQMGLALEESKPSKFKPKFDLVNRLETHAELSKKQIDTVVEWLAKNPSQQWPLSWWMHQRIITPNPPKDSLGNSIRDMGSWSWDKIKKAMQSEGFPDPPRDPKE
jgi:hypothetical protein